MTEKEQDEITGLRKIVSDTWIKWGSGYGHNGDPFEAQQELFDQILAWHTPLILKQIRLSSHSEFIEKLKKVGGV